MTARIVGVNDSVIGGTPTLHVRFGGSGFHAIPMTALGGDLYQAELPRALCSSTPEFYFSASGVASGTGTSPAGAPGEVHAAFVAALPTVFADDFAINQGWSVVNVSVSRGAWARGTPGGGGNNGDPLTAWGGSGQCFVTGLNAGNSDLDGGPTRFVSPIFDLSIGGSFEVSYARWFANNRDDADALTVEVSNDGGTNWTTAETVTGGGGGGWVRSSFLVEDFVAPTDQVRVRFNVSDNPDNSVLEAGLDEFRIVRSECGPPDPRTKARQNPKAPKAQ